VTLTESHELTILDPRTGDVVGRVTNATDLQCTDAVAAARAAAGGWARSSTGGTGPTSTATSPGRVTAVPGCWSGVRSPPARARSTRRPC
jgi:hypothetical protein